MIEIKKWLPDEPLYKTRVFKVQQFKRKTTFQRISIIQGTANIYKFTLD